MKIDTVDNHNVEIGTILRSRVLDQGKNFRTVHVLLFKDQRLVLQKLPNHHLRSPNCLGSSVAGYVHASETVEQAAMRKIQAELGLVEKLKPATSFSMQDQNSTKFISVFEAQTTQDIKFDHDEIAEVIYLEHNEISHMVVEEPQLFTKTFLEVYRHYEQQKAGKR